MFRGSQGLLALRRLWKGSLGHGRIFGDGGSTGGFAQGKHDTLFAGGAAQRGVCRDAVRCTVVRRHGGFHEVEAEVTSQASSLRARSTEPRQVHASVWVAGLVSVRLVVRAVHEPVRVGGRGGRRRRGCPCTTHGQGVGVEPALGAVATGRGCQCQENTGGAGGAGPCVAARGSRIVLPFSADGGRCRLDPGEGPRPHRDAGGALHRQNRRAARGARLARTCERGAANVAILRKLALNTARLETTGMIVRHKLNRAGWDHEFLRKLQLQMCYFRMRLPCGQLWHARQLTHYLLCQNTFIA